MSTLTKVLIIVLSLSAIFLSGIVVTYVSTADDYRQQYDTARTERDSSRQRTNQLQEQLNKELEQAEQRQQRLREELASVQDEAEEAINRMRSVERENTLLSQKVADWASIVEDFHQTTRQQQQMLESTQNKLEEVQARNINLEKELDQTADELVQRMGIIETLRSENRQLEEQRTEMQQRLSRVMYDTGERAVTPEPVTRVDRVAEPVTPRTDVDLAEEISLTGVVLDVDPDESLATVSLGSADGVQKGMRFHVIRDQDYICDIVITDVEPEEAVGVLELVQQQPGSGDTATTNL